MLTVRVIVSFTSQNSAHFETATTVVAEVWFVHEVVKCASDAGRILFFFLALGEKGFMLLLESLVLPLEGVVFLLEGVVFLLEGVVFLLKVFVLLLQRVQSIAEVGDDRMVHLRVCKQRPVLVFVVHAVFAHACDQHVVVGVRTDVFEKFVDQSGVRGHAFAPASQKLSRARAPVRASLRYGPGDARPLYVVSFRAFRTFSNKSTLDHILAHRRDARHR